MLSRWQTQFYALQAGFNGQALATVVAIAQAESNLNPSATNVNRDGSIDRGLLQINNVYHAEVTDACAYDPACAMTAAFRISRRGTDFTAWSTYTGGAYLRYLAGTAQSTQRQAPGKPWYDYPINSLNDYATVYRGPGTDTPHYAVDIEAPLDTPFSFLASGVIKQADYAPWGGEVFLQPDTGGPEEYVYHLDQINVSVGQHVNAGQIVGLSGGQTAGGQHPTQPRFSTGPHIHFGLFTKYLTTGTDVGTIPYGPNPDSLIASARAGDTGQELTTTTSTTTSTATDGTETPTPLSQRVNDTLSNIPGFAGLAIALDEIESFPGIIWYNPGTTVSLVPGGSVGDVINGAASAIFDPGDYIGAGIRSVLDTIFSNAIPAIVRGAIAGVGLALIIALIWRATSGSLASIAKVAEVAA